MEETISLELDELQRRYRIMEGDRKSYADEVQTVVRKQKAQIEKLNRENAQLKSELSLQSRAATLGDTGIVSTRMTQLQDASDAITRQIELEKRKCEELDARLRQVREGLINERREAGGANAALEQNQQITKQTKVLDHRLHRALTKFNEVIAANKELREEIDNLQRERVVFDCIYKKLQQELAEKKKKVTDIIGAANVAYEARDRAQAEIAGLKAQEEKEQAEFQEEWKELGLKLEEDRKRQDAIARERARLLVGEQRGEISLQNEAKGANGGSSGLGVDSVQQTDTTETVKTYVKAFSKLRDATGLADLEEMVAQFIESEEQDFKRFKYLNELNAEVAKGDEAIAETKAEIDRYIGMDKGASSQRNKITKELQDKVSEYSSKKTQLEEQEQQDTSMIAEITSIIQRLAERLGGDVPMLQDMAAQDGCNRKNVMVYLGVVEQRANEMLSAFMLQRSAAAPLGAESTATPVGGFSIGPSTPRGQAALSIAAPMTTEDSEDSDGHEERPMSRDELRSKTMRGLAKHQPSAGKAATASTVSKRPDLAFGTRRAAGGGRT